jgi:hypothetical protein
MQFLGAVFSLLVLPALAFDYFLVQWLFLFSGGVTHFFPLTLS